MVAGYFVFKSNNLEREGEEARVTAQNRLAEMSGVLKEGEITWSRLAQEKEIQLDELRDQIPELIARVEERDEEIQNLTIAMANFRNVRVVVRNENVTQETVPTPDGEPDRVRVTFDEVWNDFMRVHGFTLTNPAEAEISLDYTRPVRIAVVTTQQEDLSWRTLVSTDIPNLEIGEIESIVNPLARPHESRSWEDDILLGIGGSVGVRGEMGTAHLYVGYDAGDWDLGVTLGGIFTTNGIDFAPGLELRFAPFAL